MFEPGRIIKTFKSKSGKEIVLRYVKWEDLNSLLILINELSKEDTFIHIGNKKIKREEEIEFLADVFKASEKGNKSYICAFHHGEIVGGCSVDRDTQGNRSEHVGKIGIIIRKSYRDDGIGKKMLKALTEEAKEKMKLKLLKLSVYGPNKKALILYKKLGFKKAGVIPKAIFYRGKYVDDIRLYLEL